MSGLFVYVFILKPIAVLRLKWNLKVSSCVYSLWTPEGERKKGSVQLNYLDVSWFIGVFVLLSSSFYCSQLLFLSSFLSFLPFFFLPFFLSFFLSSVSLLISHFASGSDRRLYQRAAWHGRAGDHEDQLQPGCLAAWVASVAPSSRLQPGLQSIIDESTVCCSKTRSIFQPV